MNWFRRLALVCFSYVFKRHVQTLEASTVRMQAAPKSRAAELQAESRLPYRNMRLYLTAQLRMTAQTAASVSICSLLAMYLVRRRLASELADAMRVCLLCTFWLVAWLPSLRQRNTDPGLVQLRHLHRCHQKPARKHREAIKTCRKTPTGPDSQHVLGRMGKPCSF